MTLPTPRLDDRSFQDLVDDGKRLVQQRCPEWTDHNVSDPGVTLIEAFAMMVDQMLYRLNRLPDRHYLRFLDLIGLRLFPPTAAQADVTFWLSAPQPDSVTIPDATTIATVRTEADEAIVFSTTRELVIPTATVVSVLTQVVGDEPVDAAGALARGEDVRAFSDRPAPGDCLLVGLSNPVPASALSLSFTCPVEGVGVDPRDPPLVWEALTANGWEACEVDSDDTGGLNRSGQVVVHVPATHEAAVVARQGGGWVRARVVECVEDQPPYRDTPVVQSVSATVVGGTVSAVHAQVVENEEFGVSAGVPGQRFALRVSPVVPDESPLVCEVSDGTGWVEWTQVRGFADSTPEDLHFLLDAADGAIEFGPAVRLPDGGLRNYGAVPAKGAVLRLRAYRAGGGKKGNVAAGSLRVLKSSVPYVSRVENRYAATGGVDGEDVSNAIIRGPLELRTRARAVTAEDYEVLAKQAAPEAARVRCVPAVGDQEANGARVLVVPALPEKPGGRIAFEDLVPPRRVLSTIADYLDERRTIGARVVVEPPYYQGVTVVAQLVARRRASAERLREEALLALYRYLDPLRGGPEGTGWPFGRPVQAGDVFAILQRLSGTDIVQDVRLFPANPTDGSRGAETARIDLDRHALVYSFEHQVRVSPS